VPAGLLARGAFRWRAGDALLISRKDQTRVADTERAVRDLTDATARIVGTVMNAY